MQSYLRKVKQSLVSERFKRRKKNLVYENFLNSEQSSILNHF